MAQLDLDWARETARILKRRGVKDSGSATSTRIQALLDALLARPVPTEWREVVRRWRPDIDPQMLTPASMRQHVHRIRELLTRANGCVNPDQFHGSAPFRCRTRVTHLLTNAQLLFDGGATDAAITAFDHALVLCERYELPDLGVQAASSLRRIESAAKGWKTLETLDARIKRLQQLCIVEQDVLRLQDHARLYLREYTRQPQRSIEHLSTIISTLRAHRDHGSTAAALAHYRVLLWRAALVQDTSSMIRYGDQAASFLRNCTHHFTIGLLTEFEGARLSAAFTDKNVDLARTVWHQVRHDVAPGGSNWITLLQLYFLTCTHTRCYLEARDALWTYESQRRHSGPKWRIRLWKLYRAYMLLIIDHGLIPEGPFSGATRPYGAVLERQFTDLDQDKPVGGAAVLIYRVLQLIRSRRYADVIDVTDRLRQHASRYLRHGNTLRTRVFIRMLATLPAADFDADNARKRGSAIMARYQNEIQAKRDDAEIIPYEDLWEMVLNDLT